jgi:hypothetical protein
LKVKQVHDDDHRVKLLSEAQQEFILRIIFIRLIDRSAAVHILLGCQKPKEHTMTSVTYLYPARPASSRFATTTLLSLASAPILAMRNRWRRREAEKLLESLPADVRKDIGWPAFDRDTTAR